MHRCRVSRVIMLLCGAIGVQTISLKAEADGQSTEKVPLTYAAYDSWKAISGTTISRDGRWVAYSLVPEDGDGELVVRNTESGVEYRSARGITPTITADGKFVAFPIKPLKADLDKATKEKKKPDEMPKSGLGIMNLADGKVTTVDKVARFLMPEDNGRYIAYLMSAPPKPKDETKPSAASPASAASSPASAEASKPASGGVAPQPSAATNSAKKADKKPDAGADLIVIDLTNGHKSTIADVVDFAWDKSGTRLAYTISSVAPDKDGVFERSLTKEETLPLLVGKGDYKSVCFDEKGDQIAFLSDRDDYQADKPAYKLYTWISSQREAGEAVSTKTAGMPSGFTVSENGAVKFSKNGSLIFLGVMRTPKPAPTPDPAPDPLSVDIWSWTDGLLQPMQKVRAEAEKKRSYMAEWRVKEKRFVPLASESMPDVEITDGAQSAIGGSTLPYLSLMSWDSDYADYYLIDLKSGSTEKVIEKSLFPATLSPGGAYVTYYSDAQRAWMVYRVRDKKTANLTAALKVSMADEENDVPEVSQPYGIAGWTEGDRSVILYDRYDMWEVQPFGTVTRNLTGGRTHKIAYRYPKLDPDSKSIPIGKSVLLTTLDEQTKATGYAQLVVPTDSDTVSVASPKQLIRWDKGQLGLQKAKNADCYVYSLQRYDEFPDLWVSAAGFEKAVKISDANPQQAKYLWGHAKLIDYTSADGKAMDAVLIKPDNFDPSKKYPLMVFIYEKLSNSLHSYDRPSPGTSICISRYVSNGYVVLMPDIKYVTGYPGSSALKCVVPAVQKVLSMGYIDPKRVGIQGHSWGGYEITYMITRTDIFRAAEGGASVSDMISAYGGIRWGTGISRAFQYEHGQSRIGGPPWERPLQYIENSPIFWVDKVSTPYLSIANDADGAVPWYQGIEFFTAMRRLGKEAYLFNYNGEDHGLRNRENQKHWTVHMDEFFDHYLLDRPRPDWMQKGVPYLERGKRDVKSLYEPIAAKKEG